MKLAIVGSTKLGESALARAIIEYVLDLLGPALVISGGAKGIDSLAADIALERGIVCLEHLPTVPHWHDGYKPRNIKIATECDVLLRIALLHTRTYGSGWTRNYAATLGKPTIEFVCPPKDYY